MTQPPQQPGQFTPPPGQGYPPQGYPQQQYYAPPPQKKKGGKLKWVVIFGGLFGVCCIGGSIIAVNSSGKSTTNATSVSGNVVGAVTQVPGAPTATTAPAPGIGDTQIIKGWKIKLVDVQNPDKVVWSSFGNSLAPSGKFYVYRIETTNTNNQTQSFGTKFKTVLYDDHSAKYDSSSIANSFEVDEYAKLQGDDSKSSAITPRGNAKYRLLFDIAKDSTPGRLDIEEDNFGSGDHISFDFPKK